MAMFPDAKVRDDRGRLVPLAPTRFSLAGPSRGEGAAFPPSAEQRRQGVRFLLAMAPLTAAMSLAPVGLFIMGMIRAWVMFTMVGAFTLVEIWVGWQITRRVRARKFATALVAVSRCGSCAHDLTGLSAEADGCRVCPECGAAWR